MTFMNACLLSLENDTQILFHPRLTVQVHLPFWAT